MDPKGKREGTERGRSDLAIQDHEQTEGHSIGSGTGLLASSQQRYLGKNGNHASWVSKARHVGLKTEVGHSGVGPSNGDSQTQRVVSWDLEQVCGFIDGIGWGKGVKET